MLYEPDGSLKTVTDWLSKQTVYTYDNAANLIKAEFPNNTWTDYGYDTADRLTSVVNKKAGPTTISSFTYTLDKIGNRTQMVELTGTHTYQYDALYRLTQVTYPGPQTDGYTYDALGNRLTKNGTTYTYDAADQMLTAGGINYGYDNNGNQTSRGSDTFTYNHDNLLTSSVVSDVTSSSVYNGDGLRVSHTIAGQTTNYTWDIATQLPVLLQDNDNTYVYGIGLISATDNSGTQTYYLADGLGSVTDIRDAFGNTVASYSYDVFGAIRSQTGSSGNNRLFTGEQRDGDSLLYYLRARYYDPSLGRFIGQDALTGEAGDPRTQNRYAYVTNNPVNLTDPSGLSPSFPELPHEVTVEWLRDNCVPLPLREQPACLARWIQANAEFMRDVVGPWLRDGVGAGWDWVGAGADWVRDCITDWECTWTALQEGPYFLYYSSYQVARMLPSWMRLPFLPLQIAGLAGDAAADVIIHRPNSLGELKNAVCDEGVDAPVTPDKEDDGATGPEIYLPGVGQNCVPEIAQPFWPPWPRPPVW